MKELSGNENIVSERDINLSFLEKLKKGLKVKKFILDFNSSDITNQAAEVYYNDCQEFQINYFNYGFELNSPEYLQL